MASGAAAVSPIAFTRQHFRDRVPGERDARLRSAGEVVFTKAGEKVPVAFQVVDAVPYRLFSFRWAHPAGAQPREGNSFLVTFELEPAGGGTLLRMTETGFRERGWEAAVMEEAYRDHSAGWDYHLSRLAPYVATYLGAAR